MNAIGSRQNIQVILGHIFPIRESTYQYIDFLLDVNPQDRLSSVRLVH